MYKALITGGVGCVGKIIAPAFESDIYDVFTAEWAPTGDDIWDTDRLVSRMVGNDLVIHLAAYPRPTPGVCDEDFWKLNYDGLIQVVSCMREAGVKRILFSSSGGVYGMEVPPSRFEVEGVLYLPIDEDYPRTDEKYLTVYGRSKLACEDFLLAQTDIKAYSFRLEGPAVIETGGQLGPGHFYAHTSSENLRELMVRLAEYDGPNDVFNAGDPTTNKFCSDTIAWAKETHPSAEIKLESPTEPLYSVKKAQMLMGYIGCDTNV